MSGVGAREYGGVRWVAYWDGPGAAQFRVGRVGDDVVAEWVGFATLRTNRSGSQSEFTPAPGADPSFVAKFHHGIVKALLRHARGEVTLHGSCVARDGYALICIGESRAGKSTLAAALCCEHGLDLVSDDTAAVFFRDSRLYVTPTETVTWLDADALALFGVVHDGLRKMPFETSRRAVSDARVVGIVFLGFDEQASTTVVTRLRGQGAFVAIARSMIRLIVDEPAVYVRDLESARQVVHSAPVFRLVRPKSLEALNASTSVLVQLLKDLAEERCEQEDEEAMP